MTLFPQLLVNSQGQVTFLANGPSNGLPFYKGICPYQPVAFKS